ncbi:MAG: glutamate-1-semialdehyde 2,1-aminomutase [Candidatus Margulisiibacteriota bacterium]|jgi:glutamate-1-semialdehyde 2,1-aminomutase
MHKKSKAAYQKALRYLPGGVNSPVRSLRAVDHHPVFMQKARGPYIYDLDNNKYLDLCLSWGVHILGHNHPAVIKAVRDALKQGTSYGAATEKETELAEMIVKAVPSIEKIRFVSSGTEATMSALKLARAYTGRKTILKFSGCYHGHAEIPDVIEVPYNDSKAVAAIFAKNKHKIAAVIVEPVAGNMGVVLPEPGFLKYLRRVTKENRTVLIFDEVITGFRLAYGGAQELFGIKPDLTCLGKIIGGGFPVGAYGGQAEIMDLLAPLGPVYQAGTLSGNPVAMSAGIAVLKILKGKNFYHKLNIRAAWTINELRRHTGRRKVVVNALGSMFTIFFTDKPVHNYTDAQASDPKSFAEFYKKMLRAGIYLSPAQLEANFIPSGRS